MKTLFEHEVQALQTAANVLEIHRETLQNEMGTLELSRLRVLLGKAELTLKRCWFEQDSPATGTGKADKRV